VVLIAAIIPFVDAFSVFAPVGPTHRIVKHHPSVYNNLSVTFPVPGNDGAVQLGVPDVLFFSLFLAAAARFALRPGWTWLALTASFGVTIALAVALRLAGLPALPLLSLAFLLANADLLWERVHADRARHDAEP
jgi:hypothetical protein